MNKFISFLCFTLGILGCFACTNTKNNTSTEDYSSYSEPDYTQQPTKKVINTIHVRAEVWRVVQEGTNWYEKDAHRKETIELNVYDDGSMFYTSGDGIGGWVRFSRLPGYEYECNNSSTTYSFNQNDLP